MKIVALLWFAAVVGCSRNDKTATVEHVSTVTVTSAPITLPTPTPTTEEDELDRRVILAAARNLPVVIDSLGGISALQTPAPESDEQATFQIQLALLDDAGFMSHASDIDVRVDDGIVTLRGNTTTPAARTDAERIAMRYPGVVSVDDQLRVSLGRRTAPAHR